MLPKASKNDPQNLQKIIEIAMQVSIEFFIRFCIEFYLFLQSTEPRFSCYLQHVRGVQHFSRSWRSTKKCLQQSFNNDTKIDAKSLQTSLKKQTPNKERKNTKNDLKMEPKGLPEFPGKSRKSPQRRPGTSQETPGIPKGPPRDPTAAKRTSKEPKKSPKGPQMTPKRLQGTP